jgi:hypothetical protein
MGTFTVHSATKTDFDDRLLVHLQIVIGAKLRRNEAFFFSWRDDAAIGNGRSVVWLHPGIPIVFSFRHDRPIDVSRDWVDALMFTANEPAGLRIVAEPAGEPVRRPHHLE